MPSYGGSRIYGIGSRPLAEGGLQRIPEMEGGEGGGGEWVGGLEIRRGGEERRVVGWVGEGEGRE